MSPSALKTASLQMGLSGFFSNLTVYLKIDLSNTSLRELFVLIFKSLKLACEITHAISVVKNTD